MYAQSSASESSVFCSAQLLGAFRNPSTEIEAGPKRLSRRGHALNSQHIRRFHSKCDILLLPIWPYLLNGLRNPTTELEGFYIKHDHQHESGDTGEQAEERDEGEDRADAEPEGQPRSTISYGLIAGRRVVASEGFSHAGVNEERPDQREERDQQEKRQPGLLLAMRPRYPGQNDSGKDRRDRSEEEQHGGDDHEQEQLGGSQAEHAGEYRMHIGVRFSGFSRRSVFWIID